MNLDMLKDRRIGLLAIIGPAIALGAITVSIMLSPWFSWQDNAISDLGVHDVAPIFNISLIVCGILCTVFSASSIIQLGHWSGKAGMFLMLLSCISLIGIGIFHENLRPWHFIFSVLFFVLLILSVMVMGPYFIYRKYTWMGIGAIVVAALGIFAWSYEATIDWGSGVAIPEALTFVPGAFWFMVLGAWYYKNHNRLRGRRKL